MTGKFTPSGEGSVPPLGAVYGVVPERTAF